LPGLLMRTADVRLKATDAEVRCLEDRASRSDAVATVAELESGEREVEEAIERLMHAAPERDPEGGPPILPSRGRRPMGIG